MNWQSTRLLFAMSSLILTIIVLIFGQLSDGGEVAAFGFLGTVAAGFGIAKFAEYQNKNA